VAGFGQRAFYLLVPSSWDYRSMQGRPRTLILQISASQVDRIISMGHICQVLPSFLFSVCDLVLPGTSSWPCLGCDNSLSGTYEVCLHV
jgi:hypothetical protein